jgi:hypothetical protein
MRVCRMRSTKPSLTRSGWRSVVRYGENSHAVARRDWAFVPVISDLPRCSILLLKSGIKITSEEDLSGLPREMLPGSQGRVRKFGMLARSPGDVGLLRMGVLDT